MKSAIDSAGRLVIPKPIRDLAGLKPGVELDVEYRDGKVEIEPSRPHVKLVRKGSLLVVGAAAREKLTREQVNKTLRQVRERGA